VGVSGRQDTKDDVSVVHYLASKTARAVIDFDVRYPQELDITLFASKFSVNTFDTHNWLWGVASVKLWDHWNPVLGGSSRLQGHIWIKAYISTTRLCIVHLSTLKLRCQVWRAVASLLLRHFCKVKVQSLLTRSLYRGDAVLVLVEFLI